METLNLLSAGWPICYTLVLLHIMPSGNLPPTTFSVVSFIIIHKTSSAITLLNSMTFAHYISWYFCILNGFQAFSTTYPHIIALRELTTEVLIESGFNAHKLQEFSSNSDLINWVMLNFCNVTSMTKHVLTAVTLEKHNWGVPTVNLRLVTVLDQVSVEFLTLQVNASILFVPSHRPQPLANTCLLTIFSSDLLLHSFCISKFAVK
jgi:hypothetical protein